MHEVQLRDAKARLSALVEGTAHGETAIITRYGKPGLSSLESMSGIAPYRPLVGCYSLCAA